MHSELFGVIYYRFSLFTIQSFKTPRRFRNNTTKNNQSACHSHSQDCFRAKMMRDIDKELHEGAKEGQLDMVRALLAKGAIVDIRDHSESTALQLAAQFGHAKLVQVLLRAGASVDESNDEEWTALLWLLFSMMRI